MPHHESGNVNASLEARVLVRLVGGAGIRCLMDTGFTGALVLPRDFVTSNNLRVVARETFTTVEEHVIEADIAVAEVEWLGETQTRRAIVSETGEAMIGTEMLIGTVLTIDYVASFSGGVRARASTLSFTCSRARHTPKTGAQG
jgi:clan AA aspartic protease